MYTRDWVSLEDRDRDWPEWFALDFNPGVGRKDPPRLILGIAKEMLPRLVAKLPEYVLIEHAKLTADGIETDFGLDTNRPWGFAGVLRPFRRQYETVPHRHLAEYSITIPEVKKDVGTCEECGGEREVDGMDCLRCIGTGRETVLEWGTIDCIAATLAILNDVCYNPPEDWVAGLNARHKQLVSVRTRFDRSHAFIGAVLSQSFGGYVRSLSEQELPEVKAAIKAAYHRTFPKHRRFGDFQFRARVHRNGQLIIDVPGDACGLYVDGFSKSLKESSGPIQLDSHNVDGHHQQLALLSGLAALAGKARKELSYSR